MTKTKLTRRSVMQTGAVAGAGLAMPTILTAGSHSGFANAPTGSSVTLGFNVPQSGPYADEGADELRAYKLAVEHLNGEGDGGMLQTFSSKALDGTGILGKKVEYVTGDTQTKPDAARASARSMIEKDGAIMITGGSSSGVAVAVQALCQEAGIIFMAFSSSQIGTLFGLLAGLLTALGFSIGSVSLRWNKRTPTFTTVALAGLFCAIISFAMLIFNDSNIFTTFRNSSLSALHGTLVCSGLILYSIGSKNLPAADLTLLSLTEVLGGIFWVWLPIFGINEIPTANTIIGGFIITFAILYYSLNTKRNRRFIGLS